MKLHIKELILWPEQAGREPAVITFPTDKVAVITGWSETGKSSIVAIIDYVLGSDKCTIPVDPIRELVSWYGLRLDTDLGPMRISRRSPHDSDFSNDYEVLSHDDGSRTVATRPTRNRHLDDFKSIMDSLSGLSDLPLVSGDQPKGWSGRASFRDMAAFNFLPQHIVANPYTLFYKADTSDHREKLTRVFPVVLGTKTNEQLVLEHRLFALEAEERRISAELRRRRGSIDTWRSQATGAFLRAQELNLLPAGELPATVNGIAAALQTFADSPSVQLRRTPSATTREAVERIERLRREEDEANRKLGEARRRLRRLRTLDATVSEYGSDLLSERNRVKGIDWFANAVSGDHECPLCGTTQSSASVTIEQQ